MTALALWRLARRLGAGPIVAALAVALVLKLMRAGRRPTPPTITRCPVHGIAYDAQLEVCPECAKS